jgi:hypothetical protein
MLHSYWQYSATIESSVISRMGGVAGTAPNIDCRAPAFAEFQLERTAIVIEEAYIAERKGDFWEAIRKYDIALKEAEAIAADELVSRALLGWLRCDALSQMLRTGNAAISSLKLRARCLIQLQTARAPELFALSKQSKPKIFIGYRATIVAASSYLFEVLDDKDGPYLPWQDKNKVPKEVADNETAWKLDSGLRFTRRYSTPMRFSCSYAKNSLSLLGASTSCISRSVSTRCVEFRCFGSGVSRIAMA